MIIFIVKSFFRDFLAVIGAFATIVQVSEYISKTVADGLKNNVFYILSTLAVILLIYLLVTNFKISYRIKGTDVDIDIVFGNLFRKKGNKVVGVNTNFDTCVDVGKISPQSVHGQFVNKFYKNQQEKLKNEISQSLSKTRCISKNCSDGGSRQRYAIGDIAKIQIAEDFFYLLAYANLSKKWVPEVKEDDIKDSIPKLWDYVRSNAGNMSALNIPVIGTNFAKLQMSRSDVIKEIVRSFIIASKEKKITSKLRIVIYPCDFRYIQKDWLNLSRYVDYQCNLKLEEHSENIIGQTAIF